MIQLHNKHMGFDKTRLLACESVYWANMNADIGNAVKHCSTCLDYQNIQLQEKIPHKVPSKPWEVVVGDIVWSRMKICFAL